MPDTPSEADGSPTPHGDPDLGLPPEKLPSSDTMVTALVAGIDHVETIQHQHAVQGISAVGLASVATYQLAFYGNLSCAWEPAWVLLAAISTTCGVYLASARSTSGRLRKLSAELKGVLSAPSIALPPAQGSAVAPTNLATRLRPLPGPEDCPWWREGRVWGFVAAGFVATGAVAWLSFPSWVLPSVIAAALVITFVVYLLLRSKDCKWLCEGRVWGFVLVAAIVLIGVGWSSHDVAKAKGDKAKAKLEAQAKRQQEISSAMNDIAKLVRQPCTAPRPATEEKLPPKPSAAPKD